MFIGHFQIEFLIDSKFFLTGKSTHSSQPCGLLLFRFQAKCVTRVGIIGQASRSRRHSQLFSISEYGTCWCRVRYHPRGQGGHGSGDRAVCKVRPYIISFADQIHIFLFYVDLNLLAKTLDSAPEHSRAESGGFRPAKQLWISFIKPQRFLCSSAWELQLLVQACDVLWASLRCAVRTSLLWCVLCKRARTLRVRGRGWRARQRADDAALTPTAAVWVTCRHSHASTCRHSRARTCWHSAAAAHARPHTRLLTGPTKFSLLSLQPSIT